MKPMRQLMWNTVGKWIVSIIILDCKALTAQFERKEEGYNRYSLLPRLRFGYQFSDNVFVRYRGQISRKSPGLFRYGKCETID